MHTLERYLARQIYAAVGFVFFGFLALFAFFDLIGELSDLGRGEYQLRQIFTFVALAAPTHAYELFPIAVLIGTIFSMSRLAQSSEYTILRTGGLGPGRALWLLAALGIVFGIVTFLVGDYAAPLSATAASLLCRCCRGTCSRRLLCQLNLG